MMLFAVYPASKSKMTERKCEMTENETQNSHLSMYIYCRSCMCYTSEGHRILPKVVRASVILCYGNNAYSLFPIYDHLTWKYKTERTFLNQRLSSTLVVSFEVNYTFSFQLGQVACIRELPKTRFTLWTLESFPRPSGNSKSAGKSSTRSQNVKKTAACYQFTIWAEASSSLNFLFGS